MVILLADDTRKLSKQIVRGLSQEGHRVDAVYNGDDAFYYVLNTEYDVLLLDALLPGIDGFEVLKRVRASENRTPVLMLTALDSMGDVVRGLDAGADDYMTKPFSFEVLCARIRSVARRGPISRPVLLLNHDLVLNQSTRRVTRGSRVVDLTRTEYLLLEALLRQAGSVITRDKLLDAGWPHGNDVKPNSLDVFISCLRKKLTLSHERELIQTVRGVGYVVSRDREHRSFDPYAA